MKQQKHAPFSEQKMEEEHDQHMKLKKNGTHEIPINLNFKYRNLLLWIPIIAGLAFVAFGIVREQMKKDEKLFCFSGGYIPTGFKFPFPENSPRQLLVKTRYTFQMYVDSYDHATSKKIAQTGTYEPSNINLIGHIVKNGDNVLLAGTHLGLEAIVVGKIIGQAGKLHVLSSTSFLQSLVEKNIKFNQLEQIASVHKYEPSDTREQIEVQVISGLNRSQIQTKMLYSSQKVQYDLIDNNLPKQHQLNFAYLNIENWGIKALIGMKEVILRSPQLVIMIKWQVNRLEGVSEGEGKDILEFMTKQGYKSYTYKGGSYKQSCIAGQFLWQGDAQKLLNIRQQMLIFFPEGYNLPR